MYKEEIKSAFEAFNQETIFFDNPNQNLSGLSAMANLGQQLYCFRAFMYPSGSANSFCTEFGGRLVEYAHELLALEESLELSAKEQESVVKTFNKIAAAIKKHESKFPLAEDWEAGLIDKSKLGTFYQLINQAQNNLDLFIAKFTTTIGKALEKEVGRELTTWAIRIEQEAIAAGMANEEGYICP